MARVSNTELKGVYFRARTNKYEAYINLSRKNSKKAFSLHIGSYDNPEKAVLARMTYLKNLM